MPKESNGAFWDSECSAMAEKEKLSDSRKKAVRPRGVHRPTV